MYLQTVQDLFIAVVKAGEEGVVLMSCREGGGREEGRERRVSALEGEVVCVVR